MDTDWCLGCDRHTSAEGQAYCSRECMLLDQSSLARSYPVPSHSRPHWDLPLTVPPRRPASATTPYHTATPPSRRTPSYVPPARFDDEELFLPIPSFPFTRQAPNTAAAAAAAAAWQCSKDRAGILQWARAVHPGLLEEDETGPVPYPDNNGLPCSPPSPAMAELQKVQVLYGAAAALAAASASSTVARPPHNSRPFQLTAQNLAPPCVTVQVPHQVATSHASLSLTLELEDNTLASQDDSSLLTPATESVHGAPSLPDCSGGTRKQQQRQHTVPLFGRIVNRVYEWVGAPSTAAATAAAAAAGTAAGVVAHARESRASQEGVVPFPPSDDLDVYMAHSDETLRQLVLHDERDRARSRDDDYHHSGRAAAAAATAYHRQHLRTEPCGVPVPRRPTAQLAVATPVA